MIHDWDTTRDLFELLQPNATSNATATDPCSAEMQTADSCIQADPTTCSCFKQPFSTTFESGLESAFTKTMAAEAPTSPNFCSAANANICG